MILKGNLGRKCVLHTISKAYYLRNLKTSPFAVKTERIIVKQLNETLNYGPYKINREYSSEVSNTVYEGFLTKQLKRVKAFSLTSSLIGIALQPNIIHKLMDSSTFAAISVGIFTSFFIVGTPVLLHWIAKRYVIKLDFNKNTLQFQATVLTLFNREKAMEFKASDVVVPELPTFLATVIVKGKPLFVDSKQFTDMSVYKHLMGYDKPINLHLEKRDNVES